MKTKREFRFFSILEYEEEQAYLRAMHQSGWKLLRVSGLCLYSFEACEPEDVVYQLDYNKDGLAHKAEYVQMFADCGWEYLQDYVGYSYFRKPARDMHGEEEIFCDDASRLEMMKRVFTGRALPLVVLCSLLFVPQFFLCLFTFHDYAAAVLWGVLIALYSSLFIRFFLQYRRYLRRSGG